ncbi:MAG: hypothetical protein ACE5JX_03095 [Acidobacteriota bacterium]
MTQSDRDLLKHFLGALAYRTQKALRGAPDRFAAFRAAPGVRTPQQLIHHMSGVLSYALSHFTEFDSWIQPCSDLKAEVKRFHQTLKWLGDHLDRGTPARETTAEKLLQGPLADAMTHAGQLALLRRLCGSPIPPENFHQATISKENLSRDQAPAASPDTTWHDAEGRPQSG